MKANKKKKKQFEGTNLGLALHLANTKRTAGRLGQIFYLSLFHFQSVSFHSKQQLFDCPHAVHTDAGIYGAPFQDHKRLKPLKRLSSKGRRLVCAGAPETCVD